MTYEGTPTSIPIQTSQQTEQSKNYKLSIEHPKLTHIGVLATGEGELNMKIENATGHDITIVKGEK